jgi:hypothetical protein
MSVVAAPVLAKAMKRVRKDPIARLITAAHAAGVRFRICGATLQIDGAGALHPDDQAVLRQYIADIRLRLEPPSSGIDLLEALDVEVEVITTPERAREVLTGLDPARRYGFDLETMPRTGTSNRPWIRLTRAGTRGPCINPMARTVLP